MSARFGEAPAPDTLDAEERMSRRRAAGAAAHTGCSRRCTAPTRTCRTTGARSTRRACTPTTAATSPTWRSSPPPPRPTCARTTRSACSRCRRTRCGASTRRRARPGRPTVVGYTARDIDTWAGLMARSMRAAGARPGHKVHNAYGYGLFTGGLGAHYGIERLGATAIPISGGMTPRQVQLINDFRPEIIMVTPSYMLTDRRRVREAGPRPGRVARCRSGSSVPSRGPSRCASRSRSAWTCTPWTSTGCRR